MIGPYGTPFHGGQPRKPSEEPEMTDDDNSFYSLRLSPEDYRLLVRQLDGQHVVYKDKRRLRDLVNEAEHIDLGERVDWRRLEQLAEERGGSLVDLAWDMREPPRGDE